MMMNAVISIEMKEGELSEGAVAVVQEDEVCMLSVRRHGSRGAG